MSTLCLRERRSLSIRPSRRNNCPYLTVVTSLRQTRRQNNSFNKWRETAISSASCSLLRKFVNTRLGECFCTWKPCVAASIVTTWETLTNEHQTWAAALQWTTFPTRNTLSLWCVRWCCDSADLLLDNTEMFGEYSDTIFIPWTER